MQVILDIQVVIFIKVYKSTNTLLLENIFAKRIKLHLQTLQFANKFVVLKKCQNKFDCLLTEMFFIKDLKPDLNVQSDSIRAKVSF